jgi:hypothetical protein
MITCYLKYKLNKSVAMPTDPNTWTKRLLITIGNQISKQAAEVIIINQSECNDVTGLSPLENNDAAPCATVQIYLDLPNPIEQYGELGGYTSSRLLQGEALVDSIEYMGSNSPVINLYLPATV